MNRNKALELLTLEKKIAVVTGGASGIGRGTALRLAEMGAQVVVLDIQKTGAQKTVDMISEVGGTASYIYCDVTSDDSCRQAAALIMETHNTVDVLVNCAGVIIRKDVVALEEHEWDLVINVGLKGIYLVSHHILPLMMAHGGSVINIGSGWSLKGGPNAAAYCAAKGGVVNLTRAMAIDYGRYNIRVNAVCPGDIDTPLLHNEAAQLGENMEAFMAEAADRPIQRVGTPEDVANAVLFFASQLSPWVTGATLVVDGGGLA
jgi:NAD(P)-dependent dehydrogenase (short-subunit alcohol dehydrogenase family)